MTIQKWKEAHPSIAINDDALRTVQPFPSLYANDFIALLQSRGDDPKVVEFVRDISRETAWAYGNWEKAQRDGDASKLLADILNAARGGSEYDFVGRFLRDYAKANNIELGNTQTTDPSWFTDVKEAAELAEMKEAAE